ncbi:MAG: DNA-nicking Smr family endonuclease [Saprospiraceae bacterium]|jgi:DNA-nicking Smr family endonuclease
MEDDIDFKQAMRDVKPLKRAVHVVSTTPPHSFSHNAKPTALPNVITRGVASRNEPGAANLFFLRGGEQKKTLAKLRKGQFSEFDDEIDLHGYRGAQAEKALLAFLEDCAQQKVIYALIIHGKGLRSDSAPVIKHLCESLVLAHPYTLAYCSARPVDGGTGALYVQFNYPKSQQTFI